MRKYIFIILFLSLLSTIKMQKRKLDDEEIIRSLASHCTFAEFFYVDAIKNKATCKSCLKELSYNQQKTGKASFKKLSQKAA